MAAPFRILIDHLVRAYGDRIVLDIDALEFESGCSYALLGANGSGKSTFLRILAGAIEASGGSISVAGSRTRDDIKVGYMPQDCLAFGFSVRRNVAMAVDRDAVGRSEAQRRVDDALSAVGMLDMADARGMGLSGGETQRVALARILVRDLDVLLLDEPTSALDVAGTTMVEEALRAYRERTGCLLVMATHAPAQARRASGHAAVLEAGRVIEFGRTGDVLDNPVNPAARAFLSHWRS